MTTEMINDLITTLCTPIDTTVLHEKADAISNTLKALEAELITTENKKIAF